MIGRALRYIAELTAKKRKKEFLDSFDLEWLNTIEETVNFNVLSFSGTKQFADQLYSISSFYRNVGKPISWIIYNDGSLKQEELHILSSISNLQVFDIEIKVGGLPAACFIEFPTLLKVELLQQLPDLNKTLLFTDSDILFYRNFKKFKQQFATDNWYVVDEGEGYFDISYDLPANQEPLNFGFLILNKPTDWSYVVRYLANRIESGQLDYWSDQTAVHLLAQQEKFKALPSDLFVVGGKDSFKLTHCVDYNKIALRHFVGPVRHKMWQYSWEKVLGIK